MTKSTNKRTRKNKPQPIWERECENCHKRFTPKFNYAQGKPVKYCGIACCNEHKKVTYRLPDAKVQQWNSVLRELGCQAGSCCKVDIGQCEICRSWFSYQFFKKPRKICRSKACVRKQRAKLKRSSYVCLAGVVDCKYCGLQKQVDKRANKMFCSVRCQAKWNKANRDARMKANAGYEPFSPNVVFMRDDYTCRFCGVAVVVADGSNDQDEATVDHIVPLSKGGQHNLGNVQTLCRWCNTMKSDRIENEPSQRIARHNVNIGAQ